MDKSVPKDKGWSWMCMIGSSLCMFFVVGTFKSLGLLFVEFLNEFQASDAVTAWLMGVTACGMSLLSPLANFLASRFSSRLMVALGAVSCCLGFLLTSVASDIYSVVCFFGIFTGIGYAGLFGPSLIMVGVYFEKRRSFANGLTMAGASVGQLVIPLLMSALIKEYTLRGALVIYGAFQLNGLVAAMLLRPPQFYTRSKSSKLLEKAENLPTKHVESAVIKEKCSTPEKFRRSFSEDARPQDIHCDLSTTEFAASDKQIAGSPTSVSARKLDSNTGIFSRSEPGLDRVKHRLICADDHYTSKESLYIIEGQNVPENLIEEEKKLKQALSETKPNNDGPDKIKNEDEARRCEARGILRLVCGFYQWHLCTNALFVVYLLCYVMGVTNYVNHFVFIPPRAIEIGVDKEKAAQLLSIIGITDLIGRISGGFIADFSFINRGYLMGATLAFTGVTSVLVTFFPSYVSLVILCVVIGWVGGTFISLVVVVLIDFIGLEKFSSGFGLAVMFQGLANTAWPSFLGWLKDYTGSYTASFYVAGSMLILSGSCMFLEKCARRIEDAKARKRPREGKTANRKAKSVNVRQNENEIKDLTYS